MFRVYLEGQGDSVRRLIALVIQIITIRIPIINLLVKAPYSPSRV